MGTPRYVLTDRLGVQRAPGGGVRWDLTKGAPADDAHSGGIELVTAELLLDRLDERIFLAEAEGPESPGDEPGVVVAARARLVGELAFDASHAAAFALDVCEHAFADEQDLALPRGRNLGAVLSEARAALASADATNAGMFASVARLGRVRHLQRTRAALESAALGVAREDERDDLDLVDDPAWATLAALGEAVLATLEALRHAVAPRLTGALDAEDERIADEHRRSGLGLPTQIVDLPTPWGNLVIGGERMPENPAAQRCAADAADRAVQAVLDRDGPEAAAAERRWQRERLAARLALD